MSKEFAELSINFSQDSLFVLNLAISFIMFGVALGLKKADFIEVKNNSKSVWVGVLSQYVLLPLGTFLLVKLINPLPELALGMILVAASPGGNVSNFFTKQSNGNVALSVSLTAIATLCAVFMTPLNFEIYGSLYSTKQNIAIDIDFFAMLETVSMVLIIPLLLGAFVTHKWPDLTKKIQQPVAGLSFLILLVFMVVAFSKNIDVFTAYYKYIIWLVLAHNGASLAIGYLTSKAFKLSNADVKTITIETGIQNSGLSLVLIFSLFNGNGGMALLAAWWGIWHIISGMAISAWFRAKNS